MSIFVLKIIAYISMCIDHTFKLFPEMENYITVFLGRLAFPIFCFGIVEGYIHTKNLKKYIKRLFVLGLISQIPYSLYLKVAGFTNINIIVIPFTLLLGLIAVIVFDKEENIKKKFFLIISFILISIIFNFDYSYFGILLILILYVFRNKKILRNVLSILLIVIKYSFKLEMIKNNFTFEMILFIGEISGILLLNLYNGKKGKYSKLSKIFYYIYPLQFFILMGIKFLIK